MAFKQGMNYPEASIIAMNPPSLPGLGMVSGFNLQLQDMSGHTNEELDTITKKSLLPLISVQNFKVYILLTV